ncbi:MAG: hypothetical protein ACRDZ8_14480 [Acidimicrobiales bacterium]
MTDKLVRWRRHVPRSGLRVLSWPMAVVVVLAMAAGCGSSSPKTTGTTAAGTSATTGSSETTGSSGTTGSGTNESLGSLAQEIQGGAHTVFKAVYTYSGSGSSGMTVTIEQDPPKSVFKASGGEVLATGSTTYYCSLTGTATCVSTGSTGGVNPLAAITQLFSPTAALNAIQEAESEAAAHTAGFSQSFSTQSFGGLSADCVTLTSASQTGKYCVTKSGILAYEGTSTASFQLTSYTSNPSPSDFALPAGATVQSVP